MKCTAVRKELDNKIFTEDHEFSPDAIQHLESCADCREHLERIRQAGQLIRAVKQQEPVLKDPVHFTNSILQSTGATVRLNPATNRKDSSRQGTLLLIQRMLTAASKITSLEKQNSTIASDPGYRSALKIAWMVDQLHQDKPSQTSLSGDLAGEAGYLFKAGYSFQELGNILSNPDRHKISGVERKKPDNKKINK